MPDIVFPKPSAEPEVSIIIPVYNHLVYTLNCLKSVCKNTAGDYEVVVVDDHSSNGTAKALSGVPNLCLIRNDENAGFIASCNQGAQASKSRYILFLNNDTKVTKDWLRPLLETIKREDVGAVVPKLLYRDGTLQEAGSIIWNDGSASNTSVASRPLPSHTEVTTHFWQLKARHKRLPGKVKVPLCISRPFLTSWVIYFPIQSNIKRQLFIAVMLYQSLF